MTNHLRSVDGGNTRFLDCEGENLQAGRTPFRSSVRVHSFAIPRVLRWDGSRRVPARIARSMRLSEPDGARYGENSWLQDRRPKARPFIAEANNSSETTWFGSFFSSSLGFPHPVTLGNSSPNLSEMNIVFKIDVCVSYEYSSYPTPGGPSTQMDQRVAHVSPRPSS